MKDFLGKDINVGDAVLMLVPNYREFAIAYVLKFTPKKVQIAYIRHGGYLDTIYQTPDQLVNLNDPSMAASITIELLKK